MPSILLKNLPEHLHSGLKARAARNHRSLNKEAIALLEAAIAAPAADTDDALARLFTAGDALARTGVDFEAWAAQSRDVWR
ncbi:Arc family DNA-binding protein [Nevskia sp.]|uniref:FitA-like ribbon-helix-helix domain-containing protein n=1 Tax=Nevskia sp. TaxID=1929292 RepID=UPI0025EC6E99|nr:Arc family DNA-binding protein [Nevskia sp.]